MGIRINKKYVKKDILDEKDVVIGQIKFDPEDPMVYDRFLKLTNSLIDIENARKKVSNLREMPDNDFKSIEEFEGFLDVFDEMKCFTGEYVNKVNEIINEIDDVFGVGVSDIFLEGGKNLSNLIPLIEGVTPYFKEVKENKDKRKNKYLQDVEIIDVM